MHGLMISALNPRLRSVGMSPGQGHCVVFLDKTFYSHSATPHLGVQIDTGKLMLVGGNPVMD